MYIDCTHGIWRCHVGKRICYAVECPDFECRNCSDTQMQQAALNKPGYGVRIVYNLASGHIFKYNVYLEPGCMNGGEEPQAVASKSDGDAEAGTASTCNQNPSREIEWMPIDTAMLAPFAAMVEVYNDSPALLATARSKNPLEMWVEIPMNCSQTLIPTWLPMTGAQAQRSTRFWSPLATTSTHTLHCSIVIPA